MGAWHLERPDDYKVLQSLVNESYPSLHPFLENNRVYLRGTLPIVIDGKEVDRFEVEIELPDNYPRDVPLVRETGGRIPKIADRHFNQDDYFNPTRNSACLFLKDESYKFYSVKSTIVDFIETCVKNFFVWQIEYDVTKGNPKSKGRGHGIEGTKEFYRQELGVETVAVIIKFLEYLVSKKIKGHWDCYCGSRKELRQCHLEKLKDMKIKIERRYAQKSLTALQKSEPIK